MNLVEMLMNKDKILRDNLTLRCSNCGEEFNSVFDRLYISVKGECYVCNESELLASNILNNL